MLTIRPRRPEDLPVIVGWVPDAGALYRFTGPRWTWPLTSEQLLASDREDGRSPWVAADDADPDVIVGHFDLRFAGDGGGAGDGNAGDGSGAGDGSAGDGSAVEGSSNGQGRVARLGRVIIDPDRRRSGRGARMVRLALEQARAEGATAMELTVIDGNTAAIRTYEGLGFAALPARERPDARIMWVAL